MKVLLLLISISLVLVGCGPMDTNGNHTDEQQVTYEGMIYEIHTGERNSLLVIKELDDPHVSQEEWYGKEAVTFGINEAQLIDEQGQKMSAEDFQVGDQVKIWFSGIVAESYPGQAKADKVQMVKRYE